MDPGNRLFDYVIAGPNGAGKSTIAPALLREMKTVRRFINADMIAQGLAELDPNAVALEAARIMLLEFEKLASRRMNFAFETTLAGKSLAFRLRELSVSGHEVHLVYLWLRSPDLAVARVAQRVRAGGHDVPETTIRKRYALSRRNFLETYRCIAASWRVYNSLESEQVTLIAQGSHATIHAVGDETLWRMFQTT